MPQLTNDFKKRRAIRLSTFIPDPVHFLIIQASKKAVGGAERDTRKAFRHLCQCGTGRRNIVSVGVRERAISILQSAQKYNGRILRPFYFYQLVNYFLLAKNLL